MREFQRDTSFGVRTESGRRTDVVNDPEERAFTLRETERPGFRLETLSPVVLIGLGTTGSAITNRTIRRLVTETGGVPRSVAYLMVDSAAESPDVVDPMHHIHVGINGSGTAAVEGREALLENYADIAACLERRCVELSADDPLVPAQHSARESIAVYLIAGQGGASGGMLDPAITLANDVMRRRGVQYPRIHVILLGPEMPMRDAERTVVTEQQLVVRDNAATTLTRLLHDHMSCELITEHPPGGLPFSLRACDRLWSLSLLDQSNGHYECAVTDEFAEMVAMSCFSTIFTHCMEFVEDRVKDYEKLRVTRRGLIRGNANRLPNKDQNHGC